MEDAISYLERQHTAPGHKEGTMLKIGEQTIIEIGTAITSVLLDHMPDLDKEFGPVAFWQGHVRLRCGQVRSRGVA